MLFIFSYSKFFLKKSETTRKSSGTKNIQLYLSKAILLYGRVKIQRYGTPNKILLPLYFPKIADNTLTLYSIYLELRWYNINFILLLYTYIFTVLSRLLLNYFIKHNNWTAYFVLATFLGHSKTENLNQTLSVPFVCCVVLQVGHWQFLPPLS